MPDVIGFIPTGLLLVAVFDSDSDLLNLLVLYSSPQTISLPRSKIFFGVRVQVFPGRGVSISGEGYGNSLYSGVNLYIAKLRRFFYAWFSVSNPVLKIYLE